MYSNYNIMYSIKYKLKYRSDMITLTNVSYIRTR